MPHIIVEYSEHLSVDIPKLLEDLHYDLSEKETINIHTIKSRAIPVKYTIVGDGKDADLMIHITVRMLPGRSDDLKKSIAQSLHETARKAVPDDRINISVEIQELHAESYVQ